MFVLLLLLQLFFSASVEILSKEQLQLCTTMIAQLTPESRYQTLGVAWNNLIPHERSHVLREIALFESETVTTEELNRISQQKDIDVIDQLEKEHECVPAAFFTAPQQIWNTMTDAEKQLTLHEITDALEL